MKYKCVIFDCDGVLVDSEPITSHILYKMSGELGLPFDLEFFVNHFTGKSLNEIIRFFDSCLTHGLPDEFEHDYRRRTFKAFEDRLKPIPGITETLDNLSVPCCVASSGPLSKIQHNLNIVGLSERFKEKMFSCYEIDKWKPEPEIFLYAAQEMGFHPADCAVIEDSTVGVQAALNGGFDVFHFTKKSGSSQNFSETVFSFHNMYDLSDLLHSIER